jgi:hypothetical protein
MTTDAAGRFHPMWCDNRTGISQLWTAAVAVSGSAVRNGDAQLASLDDVTSKVEAVVDTVRFDPVGSSQDEARRRPDALAGRG